MSSTQSMQTALRRYASAERKATNEWFFKTGAGEYGAHDQFIGVRVPDIRKAAKPFITAPIGEVKKLLASKIHEDRLMALVILTGKYAKADDTGKQKLFDFYLKHTQHINNWDLVDISAHKIVGAHLLNRPRSCLTKLAKSPNMWERRIAIIACWKFNQNGDTEYTFTLAKMLLKDKQDLMHKATGWMLREAGKKNLKGLEQFLKDNYADIPRTTLRYAIERFPEAKRKRYLAGRV